jgi:hypothetical protein
LPALNTAVRSAAVRALGEVANRIVPSSGANKSFSGGGDGWYSYGGGGMGGLLGPGGGSQLNIGLSRFRNTAEFIGAFTADDLVNACTRLRGETVGSLDWKLKHIATGTLITEEGGDTNSDLADSVPLFKNNPVELFRYRELAKLLRNPNPYQTWFDFISMSTMYGDLTGNGIIFEDNISPQGWPEFLWPLNTAWVQPQVDAYQGLAGYRYQAGAVTLWMEPEEAMHYRMNNPGSYFWGIGIIQALAGVLDSQVGIDEYQRGFFANGAVLSGVIQAEKPLTLNSSNSSKLKSKTSSRAFATTSKWLYSLTT